MKKLVFCKRYDKACGKARRRSKRGEKQRVVKEGFHYMVMSETKYQMGHEHNNGYRFFCNSRSWNMQLVFTTEPIEKIPFWKRIQLGIEIWKASRKKQK